MLTGLCWAKNLEAVGRFKSKQAGLEQVRPREPGVKRSTAVNRLRAGLSISEHQKGSFRSEGIQAFDTQESVHIINP